MNNILKIRNLVHKFIDKDENGEVTSEKYAVDDVSLDVAKGDFIAILGHNGSGKSTLAKHINALLMPTSGTVFVNGKDVSKEENQWEVRQNAGMVFQNPDNQIIASVVEEDVGFGPENLGVATKDIWIRVENALKSVGMTEYRKHSPTRLSGGQKQRVAIAGVFAMKPECIVLDEPTAMLDPHGRREVMDTLRELNKQEHVTIILITHHMDEVTGADKLFVMNEGKIVLSGIPREVFSQENYDLLHRIGLDTPLTVAMVHALRTSGIAVPESFTTEEFVHNIKKMWETKAETSKNVENPPSLTDAGQDAQENGSKQEPLLSLRNINFIYSPDSVYRKQALFDVSMDIYPGEFVGIIGHTGSGKSTLVQHMNGLNTPSSGQILYKNQNIHEKQYNLNDLRKKIGMVFQYPEHQLFAATVLEDVCFGPENLGYDKETAEKYAKNALQMTGLGETVYEMSPFELSGGQKRRAAIAGVLAMQPEIVIFDEPTAALDPRGRDEIYALLAKLQKETNITIILVSHSMEDMAKYAKRLIVMDKGRKVMDGTPMEIFRNKEALRKMGLDVPEVTKLMEQLRTAGLPVNTEMIREEEAVREIRRIWKGKQIC